MKRFRKLIPAVVLLLVSAIMMSTATYAWFSMNNKVSVTGMEVKTKVSSNLFIADGVSLSHTAKAEEGNFVSALRATNIKGILEPVSTVNGTSFFYTTDASASGAKVGSEAYIQYSSSAAAGSDAALYDSAFSQAYGVTTSDAAIYDGQTGAVPYVDYVFQLKAVNTEDTAKKIKLTQLDLTYTQDDAETDNNKAFRVAVFCKKFDTNPEAGEGNLIGIYGPSDAALFGSSAVETTTNKGTVNNYNSATELVEVTANETEYFKVVVRLYLEGEDTTCYNDMFIHLNGYWTLDLALEFDTETAAVSALTIK